MTPLILRFMSKLRGLFGQGRTSREFGDEVETHVELLTERHIRQGMSREDAAWAARRQFGNTALLEQRQRETRAFLWIATVFQDVRYGLRMLAKSPGVTAIALASLALGIGANTAIFTVAKAALFDALSVPHPEQLRLLAYTKDDRSVIENDWGDFYTDKQGRTVLASFSYPVYEKLHNRDHSLGDLVAFVDLSQFENLSATIDGHAEVVSAELVSGNFFEAMNVGTIVGRPIEPADDAVPGAGAVAVISDSFWQRRFDRSPSVIGKTVNINLTPVTIIGVAPQGFAGASRVHAPQDVFLPLGMQPVIFPQKTGSLLSNGDTWWIQILGRLQPGVSDDQARASLAVSLNQAVRSTMTVPADRTVPPLFLLPGGRGWNYAAQELEHPMPFLLALAGLVLLLACVNVANLLLARSLSRNREISVRLALGASKRRVVRQMLTESLCLSTLGGSMGLLLGYLGRNILPHLLSNSWGPATLSTRFDWRVFAFTLVISVFTGIGFGVGPAWRSTRTSVNAGLKDGGTTVTRHRRGIAGKTLVILQIALCMLLLVCAGLFVRTLSNLNALDPGFNKRGLLLFGIEPPARRYPTPKNIEVLHRVEEKLAALPGVESVTLSREALLAQSGSDSDFLPEGRPRGVGRKNPVPYNSVGQSFFATMGIPILYGRPFDLRDSASSPGVAVINRAMAENEFPGTNPIGASFRMREGGKQFEVVGVCADAKYAWIRDDEPPAFYVLYTQEEEPRRSMTFEVRTKGNPKEFATAARSAVESIDKDLPLIDVRTQEEQIDAALASERSFAAVTSGFGLLALVLASIGVYGVMAAGVSRRVNEIGVRMALGAQANQVLGMVLGEAMALALAGVGTGLCAALLLTRLLGSLLFGLKPTDLATLASAGLLLSVVAILASWGPARRASHIQPVQALRHE
ncbi:MAG: ABC transporter permease [Terracidiphilus sp.]